MKTIRKKTAVQYPKLTRFFFLIVFLAVYPGDTRSQQSCKELIPGIQFSYASFALSTAKRQTLDKLVFRLQNTQLSCSIKLRAFGEGEANERLADRRMEVIKKYLLEKGIDNNRIKKELDKSKKISDLVDLKFE